MKITWTRFEFNHYFTIVREQLIFKSVNVNVNFSRANLFIYKAVKYIILLKLTDLNYPLLLKIVVGNHEKVS